MFYKIIAERTYTHRCRNSDLETIEILDESACVDAAAPLAYYRQEGVHYVPKIRPDELIIQ